MTRSYHELRMVYASVVALVLLVVLATPTLASATPPIFYFGDQTFHYELDVYSLTGAFYVYYYPNFITPILLCSGVGAQFSYGGQYLSIQSSYSGFVTGAYLKCQAGIYGNIRANGMVSGIITVVLANPRSVGYPLMQGYFMSQLVAT